MRRVVVRRALAGQGARLAARVGRMAERALPATVASAFLPLLAPEARQAPGAAPAWGPGVGLRPLARVEGPEARAPARLHLRPPPLNRVAAARSRAATVRCLRPPRCWSPWLRAS